MPMRVPIREQLAFLLLAASAIGLCVISLATWITNYGFVQDAQSRSLLTAASLKASQLSFNLALVQNAAQFVASRVVVQAALRQYNVNNDNSAGNWLRPIADMQAAVGGVASGGGVGQALLLQSQILAVKDNGSAGRSSLINTTSDVIAGSIRLPYNHANGSAVYLGDQDLGYPTALYPNFTYSDTPAGGGQVVAAVDYNGLVLGPSRSQALLLGPWQVNSTFAMLSITIPIINDTLTTDVLGWLTVVMDARLVTEVMAMGQGLGDTGQMLLVRPVNATNLFPPGVRYDSGPDAAIYDNQLVQFVLPLTANESARHPLGASNSPFLMSQFPAVMAAVTENNSENNNAQAQLKTKNEAGRSVSAGSALVDTPFVDWAVVVELSRGEVFASSDSLRKVIIAALFATLGVVVFFSWPLAHFASQPIRALRSATMSSVAPLGHSDYSGSVGDDPLDEQSPARRSGEATATGKSRLLTMFSRRHNRSQPKHSDQIRQRQFQIPGKVPERRHLVRDELSELTTTFNEMSDELMIQYERLEERVRLRTADLEISKKAAESANESKTMFIANISHELKTPLNGILGMCAVCMQEEDPIRLKRSLGIIYKSGDLLLNLLTDLLTFSKNQAGQQLSLDEKEFRLGDIGTQILAIFDKQAIDGQIDLRVQFIHVKTEETQSAAGHQDGDSIKDMVVWGDVHRILQVTINLVSNSLKFTPAHGSVTLTIKCRGDALDTTSRKTSIGSKSSKKLSSRHRFSNGSQVVARVLGSRDNPGPTMEAGPGQETAEADSATPPPGKVMSFEFEVTDTGPGIPEDSHKKVFEPFVQGDLGLSKKYGGTGLGLSICNQLTSLMHGSMSLKSKVGEGSTFTMHIPLRYLLSRPDSIASANASLYGEAALPGSESGDTVHKHSAHSELSHKDPASNTADAAAPKQHAPFEGSQPRLVGLSQPYFASPQPLETTASQSGAMEQIIATVSSAGKIRVLVAEDNKINQEVVLRMLKLEDIYDVTVAKDGQEALDLVKESMDAAPRRRPFNLIFMDVQMPNLDGLQSTRLIRKCGFSAPIVALTAFAEESNVKDCLDSGMNYFLSKPIRRPALRKVLREYCPPIEEGNENGPEDAHTEPWTRQPTGEAPSAGPSTSLQKSPSGEGAG